MMGCYDFCGHYEWTFGWLEQQVGPGLVRAYWDEAISRDSQAHARALIMSEGIVGMAKYWQHTLDEESPEEGFVITRNEEVFRIDMHDCPSKGFLVRNGLEQYRDYCDHCIGWIGPMMRDAGFVIDHEHNHRGQCWWEYRPAGQVGETRESGDVAGRHDVRRRPDWPGEGATVDRYAKATDPADKVE